MTLEEFAARAIGVPFKEHGRGWDGWDCWGLVVCAYREAFGITLPDYGACYRNVKDAHAISTTVYCATITDWRETKTPTPGDVAVVWIRNRATHVGLLIGAAPRLRLLHVDDGVETCHEPLSNFRIEGFYRHGRRAHFAA